MSFLDVDIVDADTGAIVATCLWPDFVKDNEIAPDEAAELFHELAKFGSVIIGGGASPAFIIRPHSKGGTP